MIATDEDALICDFAEYYHIFDYRALPVSLCATLACGLREESRVKTALSDIQYSQNTLLLATIADRLALLLWANSKDAQDGYNRPKSILEAMLGNESEDTADGVVFSSAEEFDTARKRILEKEG